MKTTPHPFKEDRTLAAVARVASADVTRLVLNAVHVANRQAVACDGKILLAIPYSGAVPDGSLILTPKAEKWKARDKTAQSRLDFPNWPQVVPEHRAPIKRTLTDAEEVKIQELAPPARRRNHTTFCHASKPEHTQPADLVRMQIEGQVFFFSTWHLAALLRAIRDAKIKGPLSIQPTQGEHQQGELASHDYTTQPCLITSETCPALIALIMPSRPLEATPTI